MAEEDKVVLEVIEYTDPYCTWCWGSEPILRKIQEVYGNQVRISYIMGGLVEDIKSFHDPSNLIGGVDWYKQVAEHWLDASSKHGMPVDEIVFYDLKDELFSTYPASIAYKAAELQDKDLAKKYLRRMREGAAAERLQIHRIEVQERLAGEVGLDVKQLHHDIVSQKAEKAFLEDLHNARARGITGFPTFRVSNLKGEEIYLHGYQPFDRFENAFEQLAGGILIPSEIIANEQTVLSFIKKYGRAAPKEVSEVFNLSEESTLEWIGKLKDKGVLKEQKRGNGSFYVA